MLNRARIEMLSLGVSLDRQQIIEKSHLWGAGDSILLSF